MSRLRRGWRLILTGCLVVLASACSGDPEEDQGPVVARINDFELTLKEYETQLHSDVSMGELYKLTGDDKIAFLEQLIRKEVLLQEAMRKKLHQREEFIRAIERYWESTLIRDLMTLQSEEICRSACVTEEQIRARYDELKQADPNVPPFEEVRERIGRTILEETRQERLKAWVEKLRGEADIETNRALCLGNGKDSE